MEVKGKFINVFDTICTGNQSGTDENNLPVLFDTKEEAIKELFLDAIAGLEGTDDDYFEENELDKDKVISEMNEIYESGDTDKMDNYISENPNCNYYGEWTEKAEDFVLGRKTIFTGKGIVIEGTKLEDL